MDYEQYFLRPLKIPQVGVLGQKKLQDARVLVVGMGGLGCPVAQYLAASGIGTLGLVDFDCVEISNLHRQILYSPKDVGRKKVEAAAERLSSQFPFTQFLKFQDPLNLDFNVQILSSFDWIIDATDQFSTHYLLNDWCRILKKPLIFGSVLQVSGQVGVSWGSQPESPCYRCLFPEPPPRHLAPACEEAGVIATIPGLIGLMQAQLCVKYILHPPKDFSTAQLWRYLGDQGQWVCLDYQKALNCQGCCEPNDITKVSTFLSQDTLIFKNAVIKEWTQHQNLHFLQWLDVRGPEEVLVKNINLMVGAKNCPLDQLDNVFFKMNWNLAQPIFIFCESGQRSLKAYQLLIKKGITGLYFWPNSYSELVSFLQSFFIHSPASQHSL